MCQSRNSCNFVIRNMNYKVNIKKMYELKRIKKLLNLINKSVSNGKWKVMEIPKMENFLNFLFTVNTGFRFGKVP